VQQRVEECQVVTLLHGYANPLKTLNTSESVNLHKCLILLDSCRIYATRCPLDQCHYLLIQSGYPGAPGADPCNKVHLWRSLCAHSAPPSPHLSSSTRHVLNDFCLHHVLLRDGDRNPDILNLANGRLEKEAKKQEGRFVPHRVVHGVIIPVIVNRWQSPIWRIISYINL
jgi:hypothetical protein